MAIISYFLHELDEEKIVEKIYRMLPKEWQGMHKIGNANKSPKEIAPQFEYNRYVGDFMADNPGQN